MGRPMELRLTAYLRTLLVDTIDDSIEGDEMLAAIRQLRLELELDRDQHLPISDMEMLKARLESMKYTEVRASQSTAPGRWRMKLHWNQSRRRGR